MLRHNGGDSAKGEPFLPVGRQHLVGRIALLASSLYSVSTATQLPKLLKSHVSVPPPPLLSP